MKKLLSFIFCLLAMFFIARSQSVSPCVSDEEISSFFEWRTGDKDFKKVNRINQTRLPIALSDMTHTDQLFFNKRNMHILDSLLTPEDKVFIATQADTSHSSLWTKATFKKSKLIVPKDMMCMGKGDSYYEFSYPVFTKDMTHCFLEEAYQCGFMCSVHSTLLFEKTGKGQWRLVMTIMSLST